MSTYVGYICKSHTPYIRSGNWYNHGEKKLADLLNHRDLVLNALEHVEIVSGEPPEVEWLRMHRYCNVKVVNEYGDYYDASGNRIEKKDD